MNIISRHSTVITSKWTMSAESYTTWAEPPPIPVTEALAAFPLHIHNDRDRDVDVNMDALVGTCEPHSAKGRNCNNGYADGSVLSGLTCNMSETKLDSQRIYGCGLPPHIGIPLIVFLVCEFDKHN